MRNYVFAFENSNINSGVATLWGIGTRIHMATVERQSLKLLFQMNIKHIFTLNKVLSTHAENASEKAWLQRRTSYIEFQLVQISCTTMATMSYKRVIIDPK